MKSSSKVAEDTLEPQVEQAIGPEMDSENFTSLCEFSRPYRMTESLDGIHFRKIVSHLFGRNKASTESFPERSGSIAIGNIANERDVVLNGGGPSINASSCGLWASGF